MCLIQSQLGRISSFWCPCTNLNLDPMPVEVMGGGESKQAPRGQREIRQSVAMPNRLPMPDHGELERRFTKVLVGIVVSTLYQSSDRYLE